MSRFQRFTGEFPWQWRPADIEDFLAERRSGEKPVSPTTLRSDGNSLAMFCSYLTHPAYGWTEFCERTFGAIPSQICFDWNMPKHTTDDAVPAGRHAYGLRRRELTMLDLHDFGPNPHVPEYRGFGAVTVRWPRAPRGPGRGVVPC